MRAHIFLKRFMLYPFKEIANFKSEKERAVKGRSCLSCIHSPTGVSISDKAWEWAVYFSDRRLAMPP